MKLYTAFAYRKRRCLGQTGEHTTREGAIDEAFTKHPNADRVASGYGYNGGFDIRSINRRDWMQEVVS